MKTTVCNKMTYLTCKANCTLSKLQYSRYVAEIFHTLYSIA